MANCCNVCFNPYDGNQRRPRVLPCGHSFCSRCIKTHLLEKKIVCPICRREHYADDYTDIAPNYDLEKQLHLSSSSMVDKPQITATPLEQLEVMNSFLISARDDLCKKIEKTKTNIQETRFQLQGYKAEIHLLKEKHQTQMEYHQICAQEHQKVISCLSKEDESLDDIAKRGDNILQKMNSLANDLHAANTSEELLRSIKISGDGYDIAREWNSDVQQTYPNKQLLIKSHVQLKEKSIFVLEKLRSARLEASPGEDQCLQNIAVSSADELFADDGQGDIEVKNQFLNIEGKIRNILDRLELQKLQNDQMTQTDEMATSIDARIGQTNKSSFGNVLKALSHSEKKLIESLTHSERKLIESKGVYVAQRRGGKTQYTRITLDQSGDLVLQALRKHSLPPSKAVILKIPEGGSSSKVKTELKANATKEAGLEFPVDSIHHKLCKGNYAEYLEANASVYLTTVLEYLACEIMLLAGDRAEKEYKMCESADREEDIRIEPHHLFIAVHEDEEVDEVWRDIATTKKLKLRNLTPSGKSLIESDLLFAVQQRETENLYSRISFDQSGDICVHALQRDLPVPLNAVLLQHENVFGADGYPGLTFLDLAAEGEPLGRLRIRLIPDGNFSLNFHRHCTGEAGPSYINSNIFGLFNRGCDVESIRFGADNANDGKDEEVVVVPGVDWKKEKYRMNIYGIQKWEAKSVAPYFGKEQQTSQFIICTKDAIQRRLICRFGELEEEGLDILKGIISRYNDQDLKEKVIIEDCGIILSRS